MNHHFGRKAAAGVLCLGLLCQNAGILPASAAKATGVTINEVCSKNTTYAAPDNNFYDWIELYNAGSAEVDLSGWGLSDKADKPYKFKFADGTKIGAGQFLVVFCDKTAAETDPKIAGFGMSGSGETITLTDKDGTAAYTLTFGTIAENASYGQYPDGSGEFFDLTTTPGKANNAPEGSAAVAVPTFSLESGFYEAGKQVSITVPSGTTVYYTTDGSDPTTSSQKYSTPFTLADVSSNPNVLAAEKDISTNGYTPPTELIDKANVIRAVAVDAQGRVSDIITKTYFVGKTNSGYYPKMKVVSLVTDPKNLFDYDTGIYVLGKHYDEDNGSTSDPSDPGNNPFPGFPGWGGGIGGGFGMKQPWEYEANYTQKGKAWERPASFTLFEDGKQVLDANVGIRIKGGASRHNVQKSFNIYARLDYGTKELEYDFFDGTSIKMKNNKPIKSYTNISLRDGGNDSNAAFFRDSLNQGLVTDRDFGYQAMSECVVFIDGEFWGIYQITEKLNDTYIKDHYGVAKSDVAMVKTGELEEGDDSDLQDWNSIRTGVANGSMTYEQFCQKVDVQSFMDYFAAQIYWCNNDWPQNNTAAWRSKTVDESNPYADGKWRMIVFDTEYGQGLYNGMNTGANTDVFQRIAQNRSTNEEQGDLGSMFTALMKNKDFALAFARTMMDMANYNFDPEKVETAAKFYEETYAQQVADTFKRYGYRDKNEQSYKNEWNTVKSFYKQRFSPAETSLRKAAGLTSEPNTVTIKNAAGAGSIRFNTLDLGSIGTWSGKYHKDYELTITAEPAENVTFGGWNVEGATITSGSETDKTITVKITGDAVIQPRYSTSGEPLIQVKKGDYNGDGKVDVADAVALQKFLHGKKVTIYSDADTVEDGVTDTYDLAMLKRMLLTK
jgi:hypothetical protein